MDQGIEPQNPVVTLTDLHPPLTQKQRETLDFIRGFWLSHAAAPTMTQLGKHFGITAPSAHERVDGLRKKGYLQPATLLLAGSVRIDRDEAVALVKKCCCSTDPTDPIHGIRESIIQGIESLAISPPHHPFVWHTQ